MADPTTSIPGEKSGNQSGGKSIDLPTIQKRGPGRPPLPRDENGKSISNSKGAIILPSKKESVSKTTSSVQPTVDKLESAKFLGYGFTSLVELGESVVHNKAIAKVAKKKPARLEDIKKLLVENRLQSKEREMMAASVEKIALRHEWATKYAPEVVLLIAMGQYTARQIALMRMIENITITPPTQSSYEKPTSSAPPQAVDENKTDNTAKPD